MKSTKEQIEKKADLIKKAMLNSGYEHPFDEALSFAADSELQDVIEERTGFKIHVSRGAITGVKYDSSSSIPNIDAKHCSDIHANINKVADAFEKALKATGLNQEDLKKFLTFHTSRAVNANHEGNGKFNTSERSDTHEVATLLGMAGVEVEMPTSYPANGIHQMTLDTEYQEIPENEEFEAKQFMNGKIQIKGLTEDQIQEIGRIQEICKNKSLR